MLIRRIILLLITGVILAGFTGQVLAQPGPPCILLGMLGVPCPPDNPGMGPPGADPLPNRSDVALVSLADVFNLADEKRIDNAASVLTRNAFGVSYSFAATGLETASPHTVWVVVYNNPEFCMKTVCGIDDEDNPDVDASLFWGAGRVTDEFGQAVFSGNVTAGEEPPGEVFFGPGLLDARKAQVHLVIRSHGPAAAMTGEELEAALTTFDGGCFPDHGPNDCEDVQFAIHL